MPLHSDVQGAIVHFQSNLAQAEVVTSGLSCEQFNWRNEPGRWSIAECIGHLNLINGQDLSRLAAAIADAQSQGITREGPFRYGWLSRRFIAMMEPGAPKKFKAPKPYLPAPEADIEPVINEYRRISNQLVQLAANAQGLDLSRIKVGLSGVPLVKLPLGARFSLLATHDSRHLHQADQVRKDPGFPK